MGRGGANSSSVVRGAGRDDDMALEVLVVVDDVQRGRSGFWVGSWAAQRAVGSGQRAASSGWVGNSRPGQAEREMETREREEEGKAAGQGARLKRRAVVGGRQPGDGGRYLLTSRREEAVQVPCCRKAGERKTRLNRLGRQVGHEGLFRKCRALDWAGLKDGKRWKRWKANLYGVQRANQALQQREPFAHLTSGAGLLMRDADAGDATKPNQTKLTLWALLRASACSGR